MRRAGCIAAVAGLFAGCLSSPPDSSGGVDAGLLLVEEMSVAVDCTVITSQKTLTDGVRFQLSVDGVASLGDDVDADAEFFWFRANPQQIMDDSSGIEIGLAIDDMVIDDARTPDWGAYRSDHRYEVEFIGRGAAINVQFHDSACSNNTGILELAILEPPG